MKKILKITVVLFLAGVLLSSAGYALGGRIPDTLLSKMGDYLEIGRTHFAENHCLDYDDVPNHAPDFYRDSLRGWHD